MIFVNILLRRWFGPEELRIRVSNQAEKEDEMESVPSHPREICQELEYFPCGYGSEVQLWRRGIFI